MIAVKPQIKNLLVDRIHSGATPAARKVIDQARCLVLNADGRPISVLPPSTIDWQEAISKIWSSDIDVIEVYDNIVIPSPSITLRAPAVLMSKKYIRRKREVHFSRHNVFMRDGYKCQYCGASGTGTELTETFYKVKRLMDLTYDHAVPRMQGGKTVWENILTACSPCNEAKGSKMNFKAPLRKPRKPSYDELASFAIKQPLTIPTEKWAQYLGWQGELYVHDPFGEQYRLVNDGFGSYSRGVSIKDVDGDEVGM